MGGNSQLCLILFANYFCTLSESNTEESNHISYLNVLNTWRQLCGQYIHEEDPKKNKRKSSGKRSKGRQSRKGPPKTGPDNNVERTQ